MTERRICFQVELLEDMHTGTGVGRLGITDDTQARTQEERPVVWAATLRGLLREAGEDWIMASREAGVPEAVIGDEAKRLIELLGKGGNERGAAVVRSLVFEKPPKGPDFVTWFSTAREVNSRRPNDNTLRQIEYAAAGLQAKGEIRLPVDLPDVDAALALLRRCVQRLGCLGSSKTRGWGQILVTGDMKAEELQLVGLNDKVPQSVGAEEPITLRLLLRNLEPLNLAATALAGNLVESQSFLAGTRLRGAILRWLTDHCGEKVTEPFAAPTAFEVGNGYIVTPPKEGEKLNDLQVIPLPLSVRQPKGGQESTGGIDYRQRLPWWYAAETASKTLTKQGERDNLACPVPKGDDEDKFKDVYTNRAEYKRVKTEDYLVRRTGRAWQRLRPKMGVLMRTQVPISRREGEGQRLRAFGDKSVKGELFSEHVIWEDQYFLVDLRFASRALAEQFMEKAAALFQPDKDRRSWLRVGRGGRPVLVEKWDWPPPPSTGKPESGYLTLTLTSDLISLTPWLTFVTDPTVEDLRRLIEDAGAALSADAAVKLTHAECSSVSIYGFNTATGLPRATGLAVQRGSVFRLKGETTAVGAWRTALQQLMQAGRSLGERTAEGFGRFVLDLDIHEMAYWQDPKPEPGEAADVEPADWRESVLKVLKDFLSKHGRLADPKGDKRPSPSQWQWLRWKARTATADGDITKALAELKERGKRLGARAQWAGLANQLAETVESLGGDGTTSALERRKYFLDELAQAVVAGLRRQRKKGETQA